MSNKRVYIVGGGTLSYIRSHLCLSAPAYGATARLLKTMCEAHNSNKMDVILKLTKMADINSNIETVSHLDSLATKIIEDPLTKIVFWGPAVVDFIPSIDGRCGDKYDERLKSDHEYNVKLTAVKKIISRFRKDRKDIFLVGFKHSCNLEEEQQYNVALKMLKQNSCNLVLANDSVTRMNMIVTPEESAYHVTNNRIDVLNNLVDIAYKRSHLTFTRSTVISGDAIPWDSELIPQTLRTIVDYCIEQGAYKKVCGVTAGHFAVKLDDTTFLTSRRKTNFNDMKKVGLVKIKTDGPDNVIAYGFKPSVGGQSQRIVFQKYKDLDCIVHFHCEKKKNSKVPVISQREVECGSHTCGKNTANGLKEMEPGIYAVYLDMHGPNIVFNKSIDPQNVIKFIDENFDLSTKTGGYQISSTNV